VKAWHDRLNDEPNAYFRVLWLLIAQFGVRPGHVTKLRWSHLRYDEQGLPCEVRANGADEGFKTFADLASYVPPNLAQAFTQLRKMLKDSTESDPILPRMTLGQIACRDFANDRAYRRLWNRMRARYDLPKLRMKDLRHWVTSQCKDAGLSEQARAYMMGHEQPITNMGEHYDNRSVEINLARQKQKFPRGVLGCFEKVDLEVMAIIPNDLMAVLIGYHDGKVGITEVLARLDAWRLNPSVGLVQHES
jgi:integrase